MAKPPQYQKNDHALIEPRDGFLITVGGREAGWQRGMRWSPEWTGTSRCPSLARIQGRGTVYAAICVSGAGQQGMESMFGAPGKYGMPGLQGAARALGAGRERRDS